MTQRNRPDDSELNKEIEQEKRKISELFREIKTSSGSKEDERINWMYKNPSETVDREAYLLGRNVDKALEAASGRQESSSQELANYSKRIIRSEGHGSEQIDLPRKIQEDPLFMIRQKEMDARRQWLNNPLKMKEIKRMMEIEAKKKLKAERLLRKTERRKIRDARVNLLLMKTLKKLEGKINLQALLQEKSDDEAERPKKKKRKKESSSSSSESDSDSDGSSSGEESQSKGKPRNSSKSRDGERHWKKRRYSEGESAKTSRKDKKDEAKKSSKSDKNRKEVREHAISDDGFDIKPRESEADLNIEGRDRKSLGKKHKKTDRPKHSDDRHRNGSHERSSKNRKKSHSKISDESSADERSRRKDKQFKKKREESSSEEDKKGRKGGREKSRDRSERKKREDSPKEERRKKESSGSHSKKKEKRTKSENEEDSSSSGSDDEQGWKIEKRDEGKGRKPKAFGLSTIDGSKPQKSEKAIAPYVKKEEKKQKVVVRRAEPVSEAERESQLRMMTENAKERKKERESDYKKHQRLKEREEKIDDYDERFLSKEMSKLTGHGSMADRIKSKRNNLQRSGYSMEQSFVRK